MSPMRVGTQLVNDDFRRYMSGAKEIFSKAPVMASTPSYCKNCDGLGTTVFFFATAGPFEFLPVDRSVEYTTHPINHKWYSGKWIELICPCCNGNGHDPDYHPAPIRQHRIETAGVLKATKPVEAEGYTDY